MPGGTLGSGTLLTNGRRVTWLAQLSGKHVSQLLMELNMQLPYDPAVVLLGIYPRGVGRCSHTNWDMNVHYSSTHVAKTQKAPSCPSSSGYIHTAEFSAVKRDELLSQHLS